jgi:hypothetical protein
MRKGQHVDPSEPRRRTLVVPISRPVQNDANEPELTPTAARAIPESAPLNLHLENGNAASA